MTLGSLGTTTTYLQGNSGGPPSFAQVSLSAGVTGIVPPANGGVASYNVAENGALCNGSHNDTTAFQTTINAARSAGGGTILVQAGSCMIANLDLTNANYIVIEGQGPLATILTAISGTTGNLIDLTGAQYIKFSNLGINSAGATPSDAILLAPSMTSSSNVINFDNSYVTGHFTTATLYAYGTASSVCHKSEFYNYQSSGGPRVLWFTASNQAGLTSAYTTISTATVGSSDWTFTGCEIHSIPSAGVGFPWQFDEASNIRYYGGNISSNASQIAYLNVMNASGGTSSLLFSGTTFYSDNATPPSNIVSLQATGGLTGATFDQTFTQFTSTFASGSGMLSGGTSNRLLPFNSTPGTAIGTNSTNYMGVAGHGSTASLISSPIAIRGVLNSLTCVASVAPGSGQTYAYTVYDNGSPVSGGALTATISGASSTTASDFINNGQIAANDQIAVQIVGSSGAANAQHRCTLGLMPF